MTLPDKNFRTDRMGTERIGKLLLEFSIPAIVACVVNSLYNIVDTVILGHAVGDAGIAVTTLALPVMMLTMGSSMLAGVGGNALAALQMGAGHKDEVEKTMGNTAVLLVVFAAIIGFAAVAFIDPVLSALGTTKALWSSTKIFVQIICVGSVFQSVGFGLTNFLRTAGLPTMSLLVNVLGTVMCLVFNVVFVIIMGFGVAGSAMATILGQLVGAIPTVWFFSCSKNAPFRLRVRMFRPDLRLMGKITTLGLASFCMQCAATVVNVVMNHVVGIWGAMDPIGVDAGLAAIGVAGKTNVFALMAIIGLTQGAQPIVGYNYGAKDWNRVIKTIKWTLIVSVVIGCIAWILLHLFNMQIVQIFGVSSDVQEFAADAVVLYSLLIPFVCAQMTAGSYFQSSGQPLKATVLELIRQIGFLIPLYLFAPGVLSSLFGQSSLTGVILCSPVSDAMACVITAIVFGAEMVKLLRWRRESATK